MINSYSQQVGLRNYSRCSSKCVNIPHSRRETSVPLNGTSITNIEIPRGGHALIGVYFEVALPGILNIAPIFTDIEVTAASIDAETNVITLTGGGDSGIKVGDIFQGAAEEDHATVVSVIDDDQYELDGSIPATGTETYGIERPNLVVSVDENIVEGDSDDKKCHEHGPEDTSGNHASLRPYYNRHIGHILMGKTWSMKIGTTKFFETHPLKNMLFSELFEEKGIFKNTGYGNRKMTRKQMQDMSANGFVTRVPVWCSVTLAAKQNILASAIHFHDFFLSVTDSETSYKSAIRNAGDQGSGDFHGKYAFHQTVKGKEQGTVKNPSSSLRTDAVSLRSSGTTMLSSGFKLGQSSNVFRRAIFQWALYDDAVARSLASQDQEYHMWEPVLIADEGTFSNKQQTLQLQGNGDILSLHLCQVTDNAYAGAGVTVLDSNGRYKVHNVGHIYLKVANKPNWADDDKNSKLDAHRSGAGFSEVFDYGLYSSLVLHQDSACVLPSNRFNTLDCTVHFVMQEAMTTANSIGAITSAKTCALMVRSQIYKYSAGTICKVLAQGEELVM